MKKLVLFFAACVLFGCAAEEWLDWEEGLTADEEVVTVRVKFGDVAIDYEALARTGEELRCRWITISQIPEERSIH